MPTYIRLMKLTDHGAKTVKETPARLAAARERVAKAGAKLVSFYMTMGRYDAVAIIEAPDDETSAVLALNVAMQGFASTESLRAFTEEETGRILGRLG